MTTLNRRLTMQIGIFSVGDVTTDPTTGCTPTEFERIQAQVEIAKKADDIGLDVFATLLHQLWREDVVNWKGRFRTPLQGYTSTPRPLDGVPPFVWHGSIRSPEIAEQAAFYGDGYFHNHIFWPATHAEQMICLYRQQWEKHGHGSADTAIVGLGGQFFMRRNSQDAWKDFGPYFDNAPVYGHGPSLEQFVDGTPLSVGSPQQILEKTLSFRDYAGDYQRQLFLIDHAGLPLKTVLEQLDLLGEILPEIRKGFTEGRPAHIPEAPTHASMVAKTGGRKDSTVYAEADAATGHRAEDALAVSV